MLNVVRLSVIVPNVVAPEREEIVNKIVVQKA